MQENSIILQIKSQIPTGKNGLSKYQGYIMVGADMKKIQKYLVIALFFGSFFGVAYAPSGHATPVSDAAEKYCTAQYPVPTSGGQAAIERASELHNACTRGYIAQENSDGCPQYTENGIFTTKEELKTACQKGETQSKKDGNKPEDPGDKTGDSGGKCTTAVLPASLCSGGPDAIWGILLIVINVLTAGVGIVAIGGIVYGAILYSSAGDKSGQIEQARTIITNVIIGLLAFALMWALLNFLIPGGALS